MIVLSFDVELSGPAQWSGDAPMSLSLRRRTVGPADYPLPGEDKLSYVRSH